MPGSYYSTIPDLNDVRKRFDKIYPQSSPASLKGINLNKEYAATLLENSAQYSNAFDFPVNRKEGFRYYSDNIFFNKSDALALFLIIRNFKPGKIIEVGSGFSSALMLDIRDRITGHHSMNLTFIEPHAERLHSLLVNNDYKNSCICECLVQDVPLEVFKELQANDILFIDSSHVSKIGSDLNYLLFEVLPVLNKGVIIHFHDIFYPFEYPFPWLEMGISWNEAYLLRAFLMYNSSFEVILFNNLISHDAQLKASFPDLTFGGSIYLQKIS